MRTSVSVLAMAILAAGCGSASSAPGGPPPPPPSVPATIAIQSGDGQAGAPGATLPVAPAVIVRDAAGQALANIAVTFAVDSGGGTIAGPAATTGANGVATAGPWQLGPSEGRQVVSAHAGSLAARFVAGAVIPEVIYPPETVPTGGGTVALHRPGLPLDGFSIRFPAGALRAATSVTLSVRSATLISLPAGITAATPLVVINAGSVSLTQPVLVRVPFAATSGMIRVVAVRNASGTLTPLPTVLSDNVSITAALGDLSSSAPAAAAGPGPALGPVAAGSIQVLGLTFFETLIAGDFDSGFRPGVDDWDFARQPITAVPGASAAVVDPAESMLATELWYFAKRKSLDGPLWQRFQEATGIPESNRRGLRWVGVAAPVFTGFYALSDVATIMKANAAATPAPAALIQFQCVKLLMKSMLSPTAVPVPVLLFAGTSVDAPRAAVAFRTVGNTVELAIPDQPGQVFQAQFDANGMKPFTVSTIGGGTYTVTGFGTALLNSSFASGLDAQWPSVAGGTIGSVEGWPVTGLRGPDAKGAVVDLDASDLILLELYPMWWRCPGCANSGFIATNVQNDDRTVLFRYATQKANGTYGSLPAATFTMAQFSAKDVQPALQSTTGYALYQAGPGSSTGNARGQSWLDWKTVRYRWLPVTLAPKPVKASKDTIVTFTATVANLPTGAKFRWSLFGPLATTTVETTSLAQTQAIADVGVSKMVITVLDGPTGRSIGTDTSEVTIDDHRIWWRLTSFHQTGLTTTLPNPAAIVPNEISKTMNEMRDSLVARAGGGILEIFAPNKAHPQGFRRPDDFRVYRAEVSLTDPAMYLTFPRGSALLVEAVGAQGPGTSPTLPAQFWDFFFINSFRQTGTTAITYTGQAANWVRAFDRSITACGPHPNTGLPESPARSYEEIDATTTPTGLDGTITFVTNVLAVELQAVPTVCLWEPMAVIRRTFSFTAVKGS